MRFTHVFWIELNWYIAVRTIALVGFRDLIADDATRIKDLKTRVKLHRLDNATANHAHSQRQRRHGDESRHLATDDAISSLTT